MTATHKRWTARALLFAFLLVGLAGVALAALKHEDAEAPSKHMDPAFFAETGVSGLTCARCHNDFPLIVVDKLGGAFTIDDCGGNMGRDCGGLFTDGYTPGRTYQMRAIISYPGMSSWGFDLWVRDANGATAGTLGARNFRTALHNRTHDGMQIRAVGNEGVAFRQNGRFDGPVGWRFTWQAPATDIGPVRFFAEGTAANRDRTPRGDYSYYLNGIVVNPAAGAK